MTDGMTKPHHGRDLTVGSIPRHMVTFSLPMLAGSALQTAYSFVNAIWVGQFLGKTALAAVTVSFPVVFVIIAVGAGLTMATNILAAQYFGARDLPRVRKLADSSTVLIGTLSLVFLAVGELFAQDILRAMQTPPEVIAPAVSYMRIFMLSLPFGFGLFLLRSMLQGIGDTKTPLYFQAASLLVNVVLDPLLMFGWLGFPRLGLVGTAWAANIAQGGALLALYIYLRRKHNPVAPNLGRLSVDFSTMWTTIRIGVPSAVQQSLVSIGIVFVTGIVNSFGENATAAFGAASRIDQLAFLPAMTFSMAASTLTGQNLGANKPHRVREVFIWGCMFSVGITLCASLLAVSIPRLLLRIFINDPAVLDLGVSYLHIVGACYFFFAVMFVSNGIINGAGYTLVTTIFSLITLWVVRVPLAYYLSHRWHSVTGVWVAISVSFGVAMTVSLAYYLSGRWKVPLVRFSPPAVVEALVVEEIAEA